MDAKWKTMSWAMLGITKRELFSRGKYVKIELCKSPFYNQILKVWYGFISVEPTNKIDILNEDVMYNPFIKFDPVCIQKEVKLLDNRSVIKIKNLLHNDEKSFLSREVISEQWGFELEILTYNTFLSSIPQGWKRLLKTDVRGERTSFHNDIFTLNILTKQANKLIYEKLIVSEYKTPSNENKWVEQYPFLEMLDWKEVYKLPYKICRNTFIQTLQYKILHRYLNCNYNLHIWQIKDTNKCREWEEIETIEHFLYYCKNVKAFWNSVKEWLKNIINVNFDLTVLEIIFGILVYTPYSFIYNFIILQGKCYIYECRKTDSDIFFLEFLYKVKKILMIEEQIAKNNNSINNFQKNLGELYESL